MFFNSFAFAVFFPIVLLLYFVLPSRFKNILLLIASYIFYGFWDWRFLSLIAISTIVDYYVGIKIDALNQKNNQSPIEIIRQKKFWLITSICTNLGILGFFKYCNFFVDSFVNFMSIFNINAEYFHLDIILPVGISFYTFQTMSYTIDIYRDKIKPTRQFFDFALFVSFFPQLVAGPIERASSLLPQILKKRSFNRQEFANGIHLIFWGLFKKIYVADNLAVFVDNIFTMSNPSGCEIIFASYAFAFQIYCDFSGYTDIARGCAKCLGFNLMLNFNLPYISINPSEFWRRWHISLSSWLRDYLYISIGGNRNGQLKTYRNLFLTMLLGGLWHGAAWTFVLWGTYHGLLLIIYRFITNIYKGSGLADKGLYISLKTLVKVFVMFHLVCFGWIIFRANSVTQILDMTVSIFKFQGTINFDIFLPLFQYAGPLILVELVQYALKRDHLYNIELIPVWVKTSVYAGLFYLLTFHAANTQSFIYFQF